jgi:hypothetical protein
VVVVRVEDPAAEDRFAEAMALLLEAGATEAA